MPTPLSPRKPAPRLTSTVVAQWGTPRKEMSTLQAKSLALGFPMRAGPVTEARLRRRVWPVCQRLLTENLPENA